MSWNCVLQLISQANRRCEGFALAGIPRPCRILTAACDPTADQVADASYGALQAELARKAQSIGSCGGPIHPGCMTAGEAACVHVLVPLIGQAPISSTWLQEINAWMGKDAVRWIVMPAIAPRLDHAKVFAAVSPTISRLQLVPWGGKTARLASLVLQRALYGERPGLFISYRRQEAAAVADQIFDEMCRRGFRVFLDRFSGTSGRPFPQEISEELADRDVVLVLETPGLLKSRWTLWEVSFARAYRLGLLALQWPEARSMPNIIDRLKIAPTSGGELSKAGLRDAADFIERHHTLAALSRRAFYEALVEAAALSKSGTVRPVGEGAVEIQNRKHALTGFVAPAGRPGRLADVHRLAAVAPRSAKVPRILAGQHQHLPPPAQDDMAWLAAHGRDRSIRLRRNIRAGEKAAVKEPEVDAYCTFRQSHTRRICRRG
jgi:hypothetical protein